jgi:DNA-directed RNA polymerases I, II, and III subunit RPABC1|tara:strand:+ start:605 stop:1246 length:642 start_codon:yes stop_codon:yes gene_type:complete
MNFLNKLTQSRETILEMLTLRGFNSDKYKEYTSAELDILLKNMNSKLNYENMPLDMVVEHNDIGKKCVLKYVLSRIRVSNLKSFIGELIEYEVVKPNDELIFIVKDKINNLESFYELFDNFLESNSLFIQIFSIDNLLRNITKHELVPKMRIVSVEEKKQIKEKYDVENMNNMPIILKSDPVAKFYGVRTGDLCEIIRTSETSGKYISYRYCD